MTRRAGFAALLALAALVPLVLPALAAKEKGRKAELITTAPDFASYGVRSIALLPIATFDRNLSAQRLVSDLWGQNFKDTGYRWVSTTVSSDLLRSAFGDTALKSLTEQILKSVRVDSLRAPLLCARLHTSAVLSVRVEQWEQAPILWNQSGKPTTSVQLKAALVDSSGTLLWSATGSENAEGTYHDPTTNPIGVSSSSLENTPITGQGGPPEYQEVLNKLLLRWLAQFPRPAAAGTVAK
jgi:hypothetical protein